MRFAFKAFALSSFVALSSSALVNRDGGVLKRTTESTVTCPANTYGKLAPMTITFTKAPQRSPHHQWPDHDDYSGVLEVRAGKYGQQGISRMQKIKVDVTVSDKGLELQTSKVDQGWFPMYTAKILISPLAIKGRHWTPPNNLMEGYWIDISNNGGICYRDVAFSMADIHTFNVYRMAN